MIDLVRLILGRRGFEVIGANGGREGLDLVRQELPELVLLDLMMPSMNGFETLQSIKSQTSSRCKIIIFTNIVDKDKIKQAMDM